MIIALDQLPRNLFRGTARAFSNDSYTAALCLAAVHTGQDKMLIPVQRAFFYMPLQHFEDLQAQEAGVQLYERLAEENPEWPVFADNFAAYARLPEILEHNEDGAAGFVIQRFEITQGLRVCQITKSIIRIRYG